MTNLIYVLVIFLFGCVDTREYKCENEQEWQKISHHKHWTTTGKKCVPDD